MQSPYSILLSGTKSYIFWLLRGDLQAADLVVDLRAGNTGGILSLYVTGFSIAENCDLPSDVATSLLQQSTRIF